jgi:opacity protein-like surface antigen
MKKLLLTTAALMAFVPFAQAQDLKPYVGIDLQRTLYSYNDSDDIGGTILDDNKILNDVLNGFNLHVGNRFHKNFGAELGVFYNRKATKNISTGDDIGPSTVAAADFSTNVKTYGATLDGIGYLPLGTAQKFELLGTAGLTWTKAKGTIDVPTVGSENLSDSEVGFRLGGGAQFNFTPEASLRGIARYQTADFSNVADHAWTYSVGVNYSF